MSTTTRKQQIRDLLKSIETGAPEPVAVVNPNKYIQHNPETHEGGEGSLAGNHSSFYDLFRVADGKIAEHWDTIETIAPRDQWRNENGKF